jgi:excisionase family DNA binding protein
MTVAVEDRVSDSVPHAAKILGVSRKHAYRLAADGKLPGAYRMGGRILVHIPTLLREIEALATRVSPDPTSPPPVASRGTKPGAVVPTATAPGSTKATS